MSNEIVELRRAQQKLNAHLFNSPLAVIEFDRDFHIISWSEEAEKLFGWTAGEIIGKSITELKWVHEEDAESVNRLSADMFSNRQPRNKHVNRNYRRDGSIVHCEWYNSAIYDEEGQLASILSFVLDVTERKRMEESLRGAERRYVKLFENRLNGMCHCRIITDGSGQALDHVILDANDTFEEVTGLKRADVIGRSMRQVIPGFEKNNRELLKHHVEVALNGREARFEHYEPHLKRWYSVYLYSPQKEHVISMFTDITERKTFEQSLQKSRSVLARAEGLAGIGSWEWNLKSDEVTWSEQVYLLFGKNREEFTPTLNSSIEIIHPDYRDLVTQAVELALSGKIPFDLEYEIYAPGGTTRWIHALGNVVSDENGQPFLLIGTVQDISERKRAEQAVRESEKQLKALIGNVKSGVAFIDQAGRFTIVNPAFLRMFGLSEAETIKNINDRDWGEWQVFEPDGALLHVDEHPVRKASITGKPVRDKLVGVRLPPGGDLVWMLISADPMFGPDGTIESTVCTYHDITERKEAEEQLREKQAKLNSILDSAPVGIGLTLNRILMEVNRTLCEMIGYSEGELLGKNARILYPSDAAYEYVGKEKYRMIEEKGTGTVETQMKKKNGEIIDVLMSSTPVHARHIEKGVTFTVLDITERKRAERVLKEINIELESKVRQRTAQLSVINESLKLEIEHRKRIESRLRSAQKDLRAMASEIVITDERARQHFATELHDTVVQTLGAAKLRGHLIQNQVPRKAQPIFTEMQDMLAESIVQSRQIMAEMSPPVLNELGFTPAIEWLAEQISSKNGISITFEAKNGLQHLRRDIEVLLFQATRELLMNVVKHSGTREAAVTISDNGKNIQVAVEDGGKGFDGKVSFRAESTGGYGLFSIRERVRHLGGQMKIYSRAGKGTRVVVVAPKILDS